MSHEHGLPYDVQQNLIRVFQSVCITSPVSFAFPATPPSEPSVRVEIQNEERQRLVRALRDTLYSRCFARSSDYDKPDLSVDDFRKRLSAANQGRDEWIPGWRVREVKPGGIIIVAHGDRLRVAKAGDYAMALAEDVPLCVGCGVTLRVRKESLALQDGTYCALGKESPTLEEESDVLRIYFNASQKAAISLVELTTRYFNEWNVPFTLKIMLQPQDRDRSDATVLYVPKSYYRNFLQLLDEFPTSLLREEVPLFTKRLMSGIGLAESPAGDESFGMHRCRLLAEGIVDAWLDGYQDVNARLRATEQKFLSEGFSLTRPHLNPGSEDVYTTRIDDVPEQLQVRRIVTQEIVLTAKNVVAFLRERGFYNDDNWQVSEFPRRNRNFAVVRADGGEGFFVKQLRVQDAESFRMMQREATVYQLAQRDPDFEGLQKLVPRFFGFDVESQIVVLEFVESQGFIPFAVEFAQNLSTALASLHRRVGRGMSARESFPMRAPGILNAHRNGPLMRWLGPGQKLLIAKVRECAELAGEFDELVASWRYDTFIHGDIKFENCISRSRSQVMLVDWELADYGEPSWDVGSAIQSYLSSSLLAAPAVGNVTLEEHLKRVPIQHFWQSYCEGSPLDNASRRALLDRSLKCAAARMIQTALEFMQGQPQPTPAALTLFDASVELITRRHHVSASLC